jgi:hypothetical protein
MNAIVPASSTALAVQDKWAQQAEKYAAQEQLQGGTFLSTRGGVLKFGDEEMPGNQACVIVLDCVHENTLYTERFDDDKRASPICYAFGRDSDEMAPHPSMAQHPEYFVAQNATCSGCPANAWGSADTGRGKACQNRRRLALIPAGYYEPRRGSRDFDLHLFQDEKDFQTADVAFLRLPVTSVENWSRYVQQVAATKHRPPHGVLTRVFLEPDPKKQYKVCFEMVEDIPDELAELVIGRNEEAQRVVIQGYSPPDATPAAALPQGSLRGLRREAFRK